METAVTNSTHADLALAGLLESAEADPDPPAASCPVCGCQPQAQHQELPRLHGELLVTWLAANYQRPGIKVTEIAGAVGLSVRRLQAVSKRDFGRTPLQLLTDVRLYRADQMLNGNPAAPHTLAEVARAAGFTQTHSEDRGPQQHQEHAGTPWQ